MMTSIAELREHSSTAARPDYELADLRARYAGITEQWSVAKARKARLERELAIATDDEKYLASAAANCVRRIDEIIDTFGDNG